MRELTSEEVKATSGGFLPVILADLMLLYTAAQVVRDFQRGYDAGYGNGP